MSVFISFDSIEATTKGIFLFESENVIYDRHQYVLFHALNIRKFGFKQNTRTNTCSTMT